MAYSAALWQGSSIILFLAVKKKEGKTEYMSTRHISEILGIPAPTVSKLLKSFNDSGLTSTKEGAGGGILLNKEIEDITLFDIFMALEGKKAMFKQLELNINEEKALNIKNNLSESLSHIELTFKESLKKKKLIDMI